MLVLFDVDATLITTARAGVWALGEAGRELHGAGFTTDRTEFAGRLDPLILPNLLRTNGIVPHPDAVAALRVRYKVHLEHRLREGPPPRALSGVVDLLGALASHRVRTGAAGESGGVGGVGGVGGIEIGLLTGNYPETGSIKLRACGIEPDDFPVQVWGDASPHDPPCRDHLPPVAMLRYRERHGCEVPAAAVTVIGDTPYDVACARASGCRALGVATGSYTEDQLAAAGADLVLADLTETERILAWLMPGR
jgi:phosphoglycolate phosphatase